MKITYIKAQQSSQKTRVAAYCRVSTKRTQQEDSLETQKEVYTARIEMQPDWELVDIYADAVSGLSAEKRPDFMRMIADCKNGKIDRILCKSVSRFSRNLVECQRYTEQLLARNIVVEFEKEHIRTDDPAGSLVFSLMCSIAQDESRSISENVKLGYQARVKRGEYNLGSNRILGYDCVDRKLVPNGDAWVVRRIFDGFLEGKSYREIGRELQEAGFVSMRTKKTLAPSTIFSILRNETYVGDKRLQKQAPRDFLTKRPQKGVDYVSRYLENDHEAIISRETWEAVQTVLAQREEMKKKGIDTKNRSAMFGKVVCGRCGALCTRRTYLEWWEHGAYERRSYKVWMCQERFKGNGCDNPTVREDALRQEITAQMGWDTCDEMRFLTEVGSVELSESGITVRKKA